jgi:hypothetical protein
MVVYTREYRDLLYSVCQSMSPAESSGSLSLASPASLAAMRAASRCLLAADQQSNFQPPGLPTFSCVQLEYNEGDLV